MMPQELHAERDALIADIHAAFAGVIREGGVSWNETEVIDGSGSEEERRQARSTDADATWADLADDEQWDVGPGVGGWSFLDPIGFRYYLPAAMIRTVRAGHDAASCIGLDHILAIDGDYRLKQVSLLDESQKRCVVRFIRLMIAYEESQASGWDTSYMIQAWRDAYDGYWKWFE